MRSAQKCAVASLTLVIAFGFYGLACGGGSGDESGTTPGNSSTVTPPGTTQYAELKIDTLPSGASVILNGQPWRNRKTNKIEETPCLLDELAPNVKFVVEIVKDGYADTELEFTFLPGEVREVTVTLEALPSQEIGERVYKEVSHLQGGLPEPNVWEVTVPITYEPTSKTLRWIENPDYPDSPMACTDTSESVTNSTTPVLCTSYQGYTATGMRTAEFTLEAKGTLHQDDGDVYDITITLTLPQ